MSKYFILILVIYSTIVFILFFVDSQFNDLSNYKPVIVESVDIITDSESTIPGNRTSINVRHILSDNLRSKRHSIVLPQKNINSDLSNSLYSVTNKFWITLDENIKITIPPAYSIPSYELELFPKENVNFTQEENSISKIKQFVILPSEFLLNTNIFSTVKKTVAKMDTPTSSSSMKNREKLSDIDFLIDKDEPLVILDHIKLLTGDNEFKIATQTNSLFAQQNASFEKGLWQEDVQNCSDSLPGKPELSMRLSNDSTDDGYALKLSSKNHYACTSKSFPIVFDPAKTYRLSFDYKNIKGGVAQYYYEIRNIDGEKTSQGELLPTVDNDWHSYSTLLNTGLNNAESINLYFYAPSNGKNEVINIYDNVEIIELKTQYKDTLLLSYENKNKKSTSAQISETESSWREQRFKVRNITDPIVLIRDDAYNDLFILKIKTKTQPFFSLNEKKATVINFVVDEYLNGWYIDSTLHCEQNNLCTQNPDGSYDMELVLEFFPQRWFYIGLLISGTTFVGLIGYLVYDAIRRRRIARMKPDELIGQ